MPHCKVTLLWVSTALLACGGNNGGDEGTADAGTNGGAAFEGVWSGYVENHAFDDGTDTLTMTLDPTTSGVSGRIQLGSAPPIAPPTDPDVGYPPGNIDPFPPVARRFVAGFPYTIQAGSFDGVRLQFQIASAEVWKEWCEMQSPIPSEVNPGDYSCVPSWNMHGQSGENSCFLTNPDTGEDIPFDCGKIGLCMFPCRCDANGCSVDMHGDATFDMQLHPPAADGSVDGFGSGIHNVHLERQ